jgi:hypothetical protein
VTCVDRFCIGKDNVHQFLRILAVLLVTVIALPTPPVLAEEDAKAAYFQCLDGASLAIEEFNSCAATYARYCFSQGKAILDYPPQTACFTAFVDEVRDRASDVAVQAKADPENFRLGLRAAALRQAFRIAEARCDFVSEVTYREGKDRQSPGFSENADAMCLSDFFGVAYVRIYVHGEIK